MFAMSIAFLEIFLKSFACLEAVRKKLVKGDGLSKGTGIFDNHLFK